MLLFVSVCQSAAETDSTYDKDENYMNLILECVKDGNLELGKLYETYRNLKIDGEKHMFEKTDFFAIANQEEILSAINVYNEQYQPKEVMYYTENDVIMLAKLMYAECRGIASDIEKACVAWTVLNRVDTAGYPDTIYGVLTAPNQFAYRSSSPVWENLYNLSKDVLERWNKEKNGYTDVGRVLPIEYKWFSGDGKHNYFRNQYRGGSRWSYSLPSPYN